MAIIKKGKLPKAKKVTIGSKKATKSKSAAARKKK